MAQFLQNLRSCRLRVPKVTNSGATFTVTCTLPHCLICSVSMKFNLPFPLSVPLRLLGKLGKMLVRWNGPLHYRLLLLCVLSCLVLANEMQTTIFCCSFTAPRTSLAHLASKPRTQTNVVNVRFCCSLPCRCITRFQSGEIECNEHCFAIVREWNDFVQIFIPLLQHMVSFTCPCFFLWGTLQQAAWSCNASNLISKWCSLAV